MKQLYLMRHAEAELSHHKTDLERELSHKGLLQSEEIGNLLLSQNLPVNLILHSTAQRTTTTANIVQKVLANQIQNCIPDDDLYLAEPEQLLRTIQNLPDDHNHVLVVAHNPGITSVINLLCSTTIAAVIPAGLAIINPHVNSWKDVRYGICQLVNYQTPSI